MPIYEYEPDDRICLMCDGKIAVIQDIEEPPLQYCPDCGLEVCRIISQASFKVRTQADPDEAAKRGFTTWRRAEAGKWEKVSGPGVDMIVGSDEDIQSVEEDSKPKKVIDLDADV